MAAILFPDTSSLRLALASGAVPAEFAGGLVRYGVDPSGRVWLDLTSPLPRTAVAALQRLGALVQGSSPVALTAEAPNWFCVLPLHPSDADRPQSPVLFELPDSSSLLPLLGEFRRLGATPESIHFDESGPARRAYVLVENAPLISLLRGGDDSTQSPRAFLQTAPRVWVEWGYAHPLADRIVPPPGRRALIRSPGSCEFLDDWPANERATEDKLISPREGSERVTDWLIPVDLKLTPSRQSQPAELWVLPDWQLGQLQGLVDHSDERLLSRLTLAVAEHGGSSMAILRASPTRDSPLVLMLEGALPCCPVWRLPNLYAPCGWSLMPPLRRDAVRARLASEPDRLVWLSRTAANDVTAHSLPLSAFVPLLQCVKYGVEKRPVRVAAPTDILLLPLSPFTIRASRPVAAARRQPTPPAAPQRPAPRNGGWMQKLARWVAPLFSQPEEPPSAPSPPALPEIPSPPRPSAAASDQRRRALEAQLLTGQPDPVTRASLWPELAGIHAAHGQFADAAACWLHALWTDQEPQRWVRGWLSAESRSARPEAELETWLTGPPRAESIRALAAFTVWAAAQPTPAAIGPALPQIQALIDAHENWLPVRAAWLCRGALSRLAGDDAIGLVRCRDRLLERLYQSGLSADLDVPMFVRFAGQVTGERRREVRDWLLKMREPMHEWIAQPMAAGAHELRLPQYGLGAVPRFNRGYVDLMLAWGLARLGERSQGGDLVVQARSSLDLSDPVHAFLADAFAYRLEQAVAGPAPAGPLSAELLARLTELQARERTDEAQRERQSVFKIERMRQSSRIIEPEERIRAYEEGHLERIDLRNVTDQNELAARLSDLLAAPAEQMAQSLAVVLDLAPRVGESFAAGVLERLVASATHWEFAADNASIDAELAALERGWFVATRFDRPEVVRQLTVELGRVLETHRDPRSTGDPTEDALHLLLYQCLRGLRRLGLADQSDQFIERLSRWAGPPADSPAALRRKLVLAAGLAYFGRDIPKPTAFDIARHTLYSPRLQPRERTRLACAYLAALGHGSDPSALARIEEVFRALPPVTDQLSTNSHFSLSRLRVVEAAIMAVVNDDFALGPLVRRWLDDDEYAVRQRIFRDTTHLQIGM